MSVRSGQSAGPSEATSPAGSGRWPNIVVWLAQLAVAAYVGFWHAVPKLAGTGSQPEMFDDIGIGQWFRYFVGVLEAAGAVGLVIPALAGLAAVGLAGVMAGATFTNLFVIPGGYWAGITAGLFAACCFIAWGNRARTRALMGRLRGRAGSPPPRVP
jgi:fructose-specific phosphotransferase system IIC component